MKGYYFLDENYGWVFYDEEREKKSDEYYEHCENEYEDLKAEKEAMEDIEDVLTCNYCGVPVIDFDVKCLCEDCLQD